MESWRHATCYHFTGLFSHPPPIALHISPLVWDPIRRSCCAQLLRINSPILFQTRNKSLQYLSSYLFPHPVCHVHFLFYCPSIFPQHRGINVSRMYDSPSQYTNIIQALLQHSNEELIFWIVLQSFPCCERNNSFRNTDVVC